MSQAYKDTRLWLEMWLKNPLQIASVAPSGTFLAEAIARQISPTETTRVVELGAGTGSITRALIAAGLPLENLVIVEQQPALCSLLRKRFPLAHVIQGNARYLRGLLVNSGILSATYIVSSLPLLTLPLNVQLSVIRQSAAMLENGGQLLQYTYGPFSPVPPRLFRRYNLVASRVAQVWRNLPPAAVWSYRKQLPLSSITEKTEPFAV